MLPDSNEADVTGQHVAGICFDFDLHRYNLSSSLSHSVCATNANVSGTNQTEGGFLSENTDGAEKLAEPAPNNSRRTLSKTYYDLKLLKEFLLTENENRDIYQIPPAELGLLLCKFFILARKKDGTDYEPGSLRNFLSSFDRYLRSHGYSYSLVGSTDFAQVRQVLNAKQSELKREGKGNQPMKTEAISDFEINVLWESGQLGCKTPESIINSLWFFNTVHFGLRGSDQHRSLCWGDISLCSTSSGEQYLVFDERQSKKSHDVKTVNSKMWENRENPDRCPINIYKVYASKRPSDYCDPYTPFYIATHQGSITEEDKWFRRQPIGKNKLTGIMKNMARAAGLDKNISNHSARKYISQKMKNTASPI